MKNHKLFLENVFLFFFANFDTSRAMPGCEVYDERSNQWILTGMTSLPDDRFYSWLFNDAKDLPPIEDSALTSPPINV